MSVSRDASERTNVSLWIGLKCKADLGQIVMSGKEIKYLCVYMRKIVVCVREEITKASLSSAEF